MERALLTEQQRRFVLDALTEYYLILKAHKRLKEAEGTISLAKILAASDEIRIGVEEA